MIYFIVVTSIYNDCSIRKQQYMNGITQLKVIILKYQINNYKLIIIENNGKPSALLDQLSDDVFYTNNNISKKNAGKQQGIKELDDIYDCIEHYNIKDDDFIVKMTGRYVLHEISEFMENVKKNEDSNNMLYDCIIKYGPYFKPVDYKMEDCITGLIGMRCSYVKQIPRPLVGLFEHAFARATYLMADDKICKVDTLGISICPSCNTYFNA